MLSLNYDRKNDILYLGFADKSNSYGDEIEDGFVVMRDIITEKVTGFTIFDFSEKYKDNKLSDLSFPVAIDFDRDVISRIRM